MENSLSNNQTGNNPAPPVKNVTDHPTKPLETSQKTIKESSPISKPSPSKKKKWPYVFLVILILLFIAGIFVWYFLLRPQFILREATSPDDEIKTESLLDKNKIEKKGLNVTLVIEPSKNDVIFGDVTVEAKDTSAETKHVMFTMNKSFENLNNPDSSLGFDSNISGGWTKTVDTTEYEDGEYYVGVIVFDNNTNSNPIGTANVKVLIDNTNNVSMEKDSPPKTQILESGMVIDLQIKPSLDRVISKEVEITALQVPNEAPAVAYSITKDKEGISSSDQTFIVIDRDPSDGWVNSFDTTEYENGEYYINAIVYSNVENNPPLGAAQVKVEIKN